jgi:hypothetical protein
MVTAVSRLSWLGGRGEQQAREHEGHRLTGVVIADPAVHLVGTPGVVDGELTWPEAGLPAVLGDQVGPGPAHRHHHLEHVRGLAADQPGGATHLDGEDVHHDDLHGTKAAGAEHGPVVGPMIGVALHRHPRLGHHLVQELESLGRREFVHPDQVAHGRPRMEHGDTLLVDGSLSGGGGA